jgi:hypothetical protein
MGSEEQDIAASFYVQGWGFELLAQKFTPCPSFV